jgi:hypothetical protein
VGVLDEVIRELRAIERELVEKPALARRVYTVAVTLEGELASVRLQNVVEGSETEAAGSVMQHWGWQGRLPWRKAGSVVVQ